ncbi:hypothetical protein EJ08DRAFT_472180 [Tothia fuscella]|uniref:Uncharacterized protein n=1 Tax=Tothia fuscella TaxID=1048955 RepID=A0A9P4U292_9PEZI|nr:hypothetical protein EJ08DRAFT_472180 [Tothia fuscella]
MQLNPTANSERAVGSTPPDQTIRNIAIKMNTVLEMYGFGSPSNPTVERRREAISELRPISGTGESWNIGIDIPGLPVLANKIAKQPCGGEYYVDNLAENTQKCTEIIDAIVQGLSATLRESVSGENSQLKWDTGRPAPITQQLRSMLSLFSPLTKAVRQPSEQEAKQAYAAFEEQVTRSQLMAKMVSKAWLIKAVTPDTSTNDTVKPIALI